MNLNILPFDNPMINAMSTTKTEAYIADTSKYSFIPWKDKLKPNNGWAVPYVTGHKYRVTWANDLDFTQMMVEISDRWQSSDLNTFFSLPFVDSREAINVTDVSPTSATKGLQIADRTLIDKSANLYLSGDNWFQNETKQEF